MEEGSVQSVGHPEMEGLCRTKILQFLKGKIMFEIPEKVR